MKALLCNNYYELIEKTSFFPIPHTEFIPPKNPNKTVEKNDFRNPVPSQPITKHSHIPLGHKTSAREVVTFKGFKF